MKYEDIAKACESLSYRDKFRLAQLLLQLGRKQEEEEYPAPRNNSNPGELDQTEYVAERLLKLREGANKSYGTRAFTGNPLILND